MVIKRNSNVVDLFLGMALVLGTIVTCADADERGSGVALKPTMDARQLFGQQKAAARIESVAYGSYARGCLAGAGQLPANGPHWQVMRLSRNRNWGHPAIINYLERLSTDAAKLDGWPGLLVGDISQPRGGPMLSGHKSHQIGLDVDIWFSPAPQRRLSMDERETRGAESVVKNHVELNQRTWSAGHARLLKRAASYSNVARIFVHPTIKKELCDWAGADRQWLRKIRAWYGHDDHFHVRLDCPDGQKSCIAQDQPPAGDGCGNELAWWFSKEAYAPRPVKRKPQPLALGDLPPTCKSVLQSE